ncbi:hypothetical protein PINS_up004914 [Pythium insidiosum]|nr:hypothetical protein PINS_up004914 [Pythium insidiosum]
MDLHEACENGNEERVLELLVYGDEWRHLLQLRRRLASVSGLSSSHSVHRPSRTYDESTTAAVADPQPKRASLVPHPSISRSINLVSEASHLVANAAASAAATATATLTQSPAQRLRARGTAGRTPLVAACIGAQLSVVRLLLGESCCVYFSSRTEEEARELLAPLVVEYESFLRLACPDVDATVDATVDASVDDGWRDPSLFQVKMVHRSDASNGNGNGNSNSNSNGADVVVPMALVRLTPSRSIAPQELLGGRSHVDDFGNTPLQCIGCFGSGATETHVDNGLEITKELLRHGDQPNLPKTANRWTPLHWAAYNGNHEQCALLLDPRAALPPRDHALLGPTQHAIPLMVDSGNLFAADIAGRRGLALVSEMAALRALPPSARDDRVRWRLRLDHVRVLQTFTHEFLAHASSLVSYVREMNARRPQIAPPAPTDASRALTSFAVEFDALRLADAPAAAPGPACVARAAAVHVRGRRALRTAPAVLDGLLRARARGAGAARDEV